MQEQLDNLIQTTVTGMGYILWGHEYRSYAESALLRIFIDSDQGITVDDCGRVSQQLGAVLDVEDLIPVAYVLEVSSPGLDRVLFHPVQYQRYIGQNLKVRTHMPVAGKRNFVGVLQAADEAGIGLAVEGEPIEIPYDAIARGRLQYVMPAQPKKGKKRSVAGS
ncbi:MAG TPA: ribosome maturation factor RimP [Thiolinea sp.]|nr:ribosome maturation factor RimP [Thiolinea sp.]